MAGYRDAIAGVVARHGCSLALLWGAIAVVVAVGGLFDVRMTLLSKDPLAILESDRFYYGLLSHVGVLLWCAAAAIVLFVGRTLRATRRDARFAGYLQALGVLTAVLMLDDLFMLHELVGPVHLGIPEEAFYTAYCAAIAATAAVHRPVIVRQTDHALLLLALGLLAASLAADLLPGIGTDVEDGFKLAGIAAHFRYCLVTARAALVSPP